MSYPLFHKAHYNIIAKQLRDNFPLPTDRELDYELAHDLMVHRGAIVSVALSLAKRFQEDNPDFDSILFLDQCSPDPASYPFSVFWGDKDGTT